MLGVKCFQATFNSEPADSSEARMKRGRAGRERGQWGRLRYKEAEAEASFVWQGLYGKIKS